MQEILESLQIPQTCKVSKRLTKKQFIENFSLTTNEKKTLSNDIQSINLEYLLNQDTINISPYIDDDYDYSEIAFIKVEILTKKKLKHIAAIIQHIPYPLIVFFSYENLFCINLSPKRINKSDPTKLVVEESYFSKWIEKNTTDPLELDFIESLKIYNHPFTDFLSFYNSYLDKIVAFNAAEHTNTLRINEHTKTLLNEIVLYESKIAELKNKIKKEPNFNEKVNMNIELKQLKEKLIELKNQL